MRDKILKILPGLRRFAFALTGAKHDADDLLQATVEKLLLSENAPKEAVELQKWAFRLCRNHWIDEVRKRKVREADSLADTELPLDQIDNDRRLLSSITLEEVNVAMNKLPEKQRVALAMVSLGGLSYAEVSEALDVPVGTVMSRVSRARTELASQFNDNINDKGPALKLVKSAPRGSRNVR